MTVRQLVDAGIKLLGIYYAARAVSQLAVVLGVLVTPGIGEFRGMAVWSNIAILVGLILVAVALLFGARAIATCAARDETRAAFVGVRQDWLYVGLVLVGACFVVAAIPDVVRYLTTLFYYSGAPRQAMIQRMPQSAILEMLIRSVIDGLAGFAVVVWARPIAAILDRRAEPAERSGDASNT